MLAALECVDFVTVFEAVTPDEVLRIVQPGICCKGEDYAPSSGRALPEADLIRSFGGQIRFLPLVPGLSTTQRVASLIAAHKNREG
jgi:bifunctional ADP-heptose synthase (sugar kinase/adenylyltransferase)